VCGGRGKSLKNKEMRTLSPCNKRKEEEYEEGEGNPLGGTQRHYEEGGVATHRGVRKDVNKGRKKKDNCLELLVIRGTHLQNKDR